MTAADSPNVPSLSGARLARYAEAINRHQEDAAGESVPLDPSLARAVVAVADAELAELRERIAGLEANRG